MYKNIELINTVNHKDISVKEFSDFLYAKELVSTPLVLSEFYEGCKDYPIVFVKDQNDFWSASAILGFKENENIFVNKEGVWEKGRYLPASIRRYPFIFISQEDNLLSLGMDTEAKDKLDKNPQRRLFDAEGNQSDFSSNVLSFMSQFQSDAAATNNFIKQLNQWELLEEKMAHITTPDNLSYQLNGFCVVNEEKLQHLSKKKKQEICDNNAYPSITAHLISLSNIQRLGLKQ